MGVALIKLSRFGKYLLEQRLAGNRRYPPMLLRKPLFQCNPTCAHRGWIGYPDRNPIADKDWSGYSVGRSPEIGNGKARCSYQGTAVDGVFSHPAKAPGIWIRERRVEGAFAPGRAATDTR